MKDQPDRFLEFNVKEGWEPLCKFLGKELPRDPKTGSVLPFPRMNDTAEFQKLWQQEEAAFYEVGKTKSVAVLSVLALIGVLASVSLNRADVWRKIGTLASSIGIAGQ